MDSFITSLNTLRLVNDFASGYDQYIKECGWHGPDMLFGMMYEYLSPGQRMLDIGIGTGLSAGLFQKAGLDIYGVDGSEEMLKICQSKDITVDLKQADLRDAKIPFDNHFHHVVSFAVFHFLGNLKPLFSEIACKMMNGGIFGFSADVFNPSLDQDYAETNMEGVYAKTQAESGLTTFKHSLDYLERTLSDTGYKLLKNTEILAFQDNQTGRQVKFQLMVAGIRIRKEYFESKK